MEDISLNLANVATTADEIFAAEVNAALQRQSEAHLKANQTYVEEVHAAMVKRNETVSDGLHTYREESRRRIRILSGEDPSIHLPDVKDSPGLQDLENPLDDQVKEVIEENVLRLRAI